MWRCHHGVLHADDEEVLNEFNPTNIHITGDGNENDATTRNLARAAVINIDRNSTMDDAHPIFASV